MNARGVYWVEKIGREEGVVGKIQGGKEKKRKAVPYAKFASVREITLYCTGHGTLTHCVVLNGSKLAVALLFVVYYYS